MRIKSIGQPTYNIDNYCNKKTNSLISYNLNGIKKNNSKDTVSFGQNQYDTRYGGLFVEKADRIKAQNIWTEIRRANSIAILTHKYPDGDAIGSGLALLEILKNKFPDKKIEFIVPDGIPSAFKSLPNVNMITDRSSIETIDLAIAVDCNQTTLGGKSIYNSAKKQINIDHHKISDDIQNYADINLLHEEMPSTTSILYKYIFTPLGVKIPRNAAECLLTGLYTDTANFKYLSDYPDAAKIKNYLLSELNRYEIFSPVIIGRKLAENNVKSEELKKMMEDILSDDSVKIIETNAGVKIAYIAVSQQLINDYRIKDSQSDIKAELSFANNKLRSKGDIAIVFWETNDGEIKAGFRSNDYKVSDFAINQYKGGGHDFVAGITVKGTLEVIQEDVLSRIKVHEFERIRNRE